MKLKQVVMAIVAMQVFATANAARNLITNFDHRERMGIDLPLGWMKHIRDKATTKIDVAHAVLRGAGG